MKTENTLENKAKFFALYWGQMVCKKSIEGLEHFVTTPDKFIRNISEHVYLQLKPLSEITTKDSVELFSLSEGWEISKTFHITKDKYLSIEIKRPYNNKLKTNKDGYEYDIKLLNIESFNITDKLRSLGYIVPWMDLTIKDLVSYGWVKLETKLKSN